MEKYSTAMSNTVVYFFIDFLRQQNYPYIIAPYESDPQLVYLYKSRQIDYIYSEDSDIVAFGARHVVKNLRLDKTCSLLNEDTIIRLYKRLKENKHSETARLQRIVDFFNLSDDH